MATAVFGHTVSAVLVLISHDRRPPRVPASGHGGRVLGAIQLIDRLEGEFTGEDEAPLRPLTNMAGMAMENARLYEELRQRDLARMNSWRPWPMSSAIRSRPSAMPWRSCGWRRTTMQRVRRPARPSNGNFGRTLADRSQVTLFFRRERIPALYPTPLGCLSPSRHPAPFGTKPNTLHALRCHCVPERDIGHAGSRISSLPPRYSFGSSIPSSAAGVSPLLRP
jgi:hypothetical protein